MADVADIVALALEPAASVAPTAASEKVLAAA
jgi:hypothetical protein